MKGLKVKEKLKKSLIVTIVAIMMAFMMPVRSKADLIADFIDLFLNIPDGIMGVIDNQIAGNYEFTSENVDFKGWGGKGEIFNFVVTPYEIFSSGKYEIDAAGNYYTNIGWLDVNFFSDRPIYSSTTVSSEILAPVVGNIYKGLRNLAMVLMLLVILYIGIKIMVSSIAAQQAKYKQFLVDWLVGFALLFVMHYIMSGIIHLNIVVINLLSNDEGDSYYIGLAEIQDNGRGSDSSWNDVIDEKIGFLKGDEYRVFKSERLVVEGTKKDTANYTGDIETSTGKLDLNGKSNRRYGGSFDVSKWGKDGEIYLAASIYNDSNDNKKFANKAIIKLNAMSYIRTISSFASEEYENVEFYDRGGTVGAKKNVTGLGYSALYLCMVIEVIMFLFIYIKRVLQMAFLTMVAPIVAIMYPVDKLGDGKAQAFNTWFKDYLSNILIQPMHLLLYTIFIVAAAELVSKNIIYGLAIYGFMIPSEKYFRKIIGFEKVSGGAPPGPLSGALGRGLAMDGLGKFAGIGPAGRGGPGGSGGSDKKRKPKLRKLSPGSTDPSSAGDGGGMNPAASGSGGTGGIGGAGGTGSRSSARRNRNTSGSSSSSRPAAGGIGDRIKNAARSPFRAATKRIARAATGGKYSHYTDANHGWAEAGKYLGGKAGRFLGRTGARALGTITLGSVGAIAGVATAMATGDVNNVFKGAAIGIGAGNKWGTNLYDRGTGFLDDFQQEINAERAKEDDEYAKRLRREEVYQNLDEDLADLPDAERAEYEETIKNMAPFVNIKTIDDVKAMVKMKQQDDGTYTDDAKKLQELYDDSSSFDVATHEDAYFKKKLTNMKDGMGNRKYTDQQIEDIIKRKGAAGTPGADDYNEVAAKAELVKTAQSYRK